MKRKKEVGSNVHDITPTPEIADQKLLAQLQKVWSGEIRGGITEDDCLKGLEEDRALLLALRRKQVAPEDINRGFHVESRGAATQYLKLAISEWEIGYENQGKTFALNLHAARQSLVNEIAA